MKKATDRTESCGPRKYNKQGILEGELNASSKWMGPGGTPTPFQTSDRAVSQPLFTV